MSSYAMNSNGNTKTTGSRQKSKDQKKKEEKRKAFAESKGNWEFSFFQKPEKGQQKGQELTQEAKIKLSMRPDNCFDPKLVHQYINPTITPEEVLLRRYQAGEKLKSGDTIVVQNIIKRKEQQVKADINALATQGVAAIPVTKYGRTLKMLETLKTQITKKNNLLVTNIYLRLQEDEFEITPELAAQFAAQLTKMNQIVETQDLIQLQFTQFHAQMPPLNIKGFKKFDEWQIKIINNIDSNVSTLVNTPTSAGKSVLSSYAVTKGRALFVVPTDALAWQMASYIGSIIDSNVPIITQTYQTYPRRDELIPILNRAQVIVGTADTIVDFLPFMTTNFKWIILDEVHMIGKQEGFAMEQIVKVIPDANVLALSATIGNTEELKEWFGRINMSRPFDSVICSKRFFNLQRFCYNPETNSIDSLHPLALIDVSDFADGSVLDKNLQPTPPTTWDLSQKLAEHWDMGELNPYTYFSRDVRIELDHVNEYFRKLIEFMVEKYSTEPEPIQVILDQYKHTELTSQKVNLVDLALTLKAQNKAPAIFFQKNTIACLRMAREFAKDVEARELEKFPHLVRDRIRAEKLARRQAKKFKDEESSGYDEKNSKKALKEIVGVARKRDEYGTSTVPVQREERIEVVSVQEPHMDFTFTTTQHFSESMVEDWVRCLKKYFPNTGEIYHFIIRLLWRGVGIYAKGLPDPYLRLVQTLANKKELAVVFSDVSLVFGVSMPFRTVVVVRDTTTVDDLDAMLYQQMAGRAGRRGLDKEGNVIFAGYSWDRVKELSISSSPNVTGTTNVVYTVPHANQLSQLFQTGQNWELVCRNFLNPEVSDEDGIEFLEGIKSNYDGGWQLAYQPQDVNHLHMNWKLRHSDDNIVVSLLIPFMRRAFEGKDHTMEKNQIDIAHFMCQFLDTVRSKDPDLVLTECELMKQSPYNQIPEQLEELQIEIPSQIDPNVLLSIQSNTLIILPSEDETDALRQRLFNFGEKIRHIQHYYFHSKINNLAKLMGKLLTRIWWIYHMSSPIMKPLHQFDVNQFLSAEEIEMMNETAAEEHTEDASNSYESDSEYADSDEEGEEGEDEEATSEVEDA